MVKINAQLAGSFVTFHGYDGHDYGAYVARVSRRVAIITYPVFHRSINGELVTAYISDPSRLEHDDQGDRDIMEGDLSDGNDNVSGL